MKNKTTICNLLKMAMAILIIVMPVFNLSYVGEVGESGFSFFSFNSEMIQLRSYQWAIVLIGILNIVFVVIGIIMLILQIKNYLHKKQSGKAIIVFTGVVSLLYMILGITYTLINNTMYSTIYFKTAAFWPAIIFVVFFAAYIFFSKRKVNEYSEFASKRENMPERDIPQEQGTKKTMGIPISQQCNLDSDMKKIEVIKAYNDLLGSGIITQEEYERKKKELLGV